MAEGEQARTVGQVFAERLLELRRQRGLTQEALARRLTDEFDYPIHRATLARIEAGSTRGENVTVKDVLAIAAALNVAPVYLITPTDDEARVMVTPNTQVRASEARNWSIGAGVLRADRDNEAEYFTTRPSAEVEQLVRDAKSVREARSESAAADKEDRVAAATPTLGREREPKAAKREPQPSRPKRPVKRPSNQGAFAWRQDARDG